MNHITIRNLIFIFAVCLMGISCNDSSTGTDHSGSSSATFKGRVDNSSAQNGSAQKEAKKSTSAIKGAVVTAAQIQADGSLQTIGDNQATTNANGEYTLNVDVSAVENASNRIIIVANTGSETAKTFVSGEVQNGSTITVQPITFETSAQAEVYQNVVANGDDDTVTKADIEVTVEDNVAADIESSGQNAGHVASALASSAQSKTNFYAEKGVEISGDQKDQIVQTKQQAEVQLESDLNAATSASQKQTAFDTFVDAVANAELDAGVQAWAVGESDDFSARVLINESADLSTDAQAQIRKHAYYYASVAIDAGVQAEAKTLNASDATITAITEAGSTLQAGVKNSTNASQQNIDALFVKYNEDVQAAINSDTSLNGAAFVSANTAISGSADLKTTLETTLNATANLDTMMSAYSDFSSGIKSIVDSSFTNASDAELQAYTRILVLINIAS